MRRESLVTSMYATRLGESVASAGIATPEIERLLPTWDHEAPFHSYTVSESLVASIKATREGERAVSAGLVADAIVRPLPICDQVEPLNS